MPKYDKKFKKKNLLWLSNTKLQKSWQYGFLFSHWVFFIFFHFERQNSLVLGTWMHTCLAPTDRGEAFFKNTNTLEHIIRRRATEIKIIQELCFWYHINTNFVHRLKILVFSLSWGMIHILDMSQKHHIHIVGNPQKRL